MKHLIMSSPPVFRGVRVSRSLVLCVCFVGRCLFFCPFSFGHCVVCPSIYGFWLPLWYLQIILKVERYSLIMECKRRTIDLKHYSMNTSEYAPHLCQQVNRKINILKAQIIYYKYVIIIKPPNIGHKLIDFFFWIQKDTCY